MEELVNKTKELDKVRDLVSDISTKTENISIFGLVDSAKAHYIYSIMESLDNSPVVVCPNVQVAKKMIEDFRMYCSINNIELVYIPAQEYIYYDYVAESREIENERIYGITKLLDEGNEVGRKGSNSKCIYVTVIEAITQKMLPKETYENKTISFKRGIEIDIKVVSQKLIDIGYTREDKAEAPGQFVTRGGIIDICPIDNSVGYGYRIELFGDEIDTIRTFDVITQRSIKEVDKFNISLASEYILTTNQLDMLVEKLQQYVENTDKKISTDLIKRIKRDIDDVENRVVLPEKIIYRYYNMLFDKTYTLLDYMNGKEIYFDEISRCIERAKNIFEENIESIKIMGQRGEVSPSLCIGNVTFEEITSKYKSQKHIYIERIKKDNFTHVARKEYVFQCKEYSFKKSLQDFQIEDINKKLRLGKIVMIVTSTLVRLETVVNQLKANDISCKYLDDVKIKSERLKEGQVYVIQGIMSSGFSCEDSPFVVISDEISGTNNKSKVKTSNELLGDLINSYEDLKVGDLVVHVNHGIGRYLGVESIESLGVIRDYIKLEYDKGAGLYIPVTALDSIRKYVCDKEDEPKLNHLGSKEWAKTKAKVRSHIKDIAKELVILYAKREQTIGHAFSKDTPWQSEFEADFEYELTDDQVRCVSEMKKDMENPKPMDRLLCGDVGYGKTEVAIRGAFKAVMDGKQVAYLVPTTVLSLQQYNVFKKRMDKYGIKVELLSRFRSKKEQETILKKLKHGEIDIVVGTHRLISKDVVFKDLAFLIIDEEHRFGVEHKEAIKKIKVGVDVLSMTATPIPRTLHMSMIGVRDVSVIMAPPMERMPVHTYVMEYDEGVIKQAIEKELDRQGQVFYLNNRVENIDSIASKVMDLVPEATVAVAHGQMTSSKIEDIMLEYMEKKIDILVCTTILESGIDVPNANTIIIENSDRLGLAQLYQIRGRVGRSNRLAHAYITYRKGSSLSEEAEKRLTAIKEYTEFGSGFKIALRDLEIRGAGNLLGQQQHGHIASVGYDMYASMLEKAVKQEKENVLSGNVNGVEAEIDKEVKINLNVSAYIPDTYISQPVIKIEIYQKLSNASTEEELTDMILEIVDRFGDMPKEVENLIDIVEIRNMAKELKIEEIKIKENKLLLLPFDLRINTDGLSNKNILGFVKNELKEINKKFNIK